MSESAAKDRRASLKVDIGFGAYWIVLAIAALTLPPKGHLWPALLCVGWAALGGYILGQAMHEWREEKDR